MNASKVFLVVAETHKKMNRLAKILENRITIRLHSSKNFTKKKTLNSVREKGECHSANLWQTSLIFARSKTEARIHLQKNRFVLFARRARSLPRRVPSTIHRYALYLSHLESKTSHIARSNNLFPIILIR